MRPWVLAGGFEEVAFEALDTDRLAAVGVHRLARRQHRERAFHAVLAGYRFLIAADEQAA